MLEHAGRLHREATRGLLPVYMLEEDARPCDVFRLMDEAPHIEVEACDTSEKHLTRGGPDGVLGDLTVIWVFPTGACTDRWLKPSGA